ncbi:GtrA domain-containing protein [Tessaracoccus sp. Y1736]
MLTKIRSMWAGFSERHPELSKFLMFFILSNGVTVLQIVIMPVFRGIFGRTSLIDTDFQVWPIGSNVDGSQYFVFDYAAGALPDGGGGLAYFLAVQLAILIAQVINFFAQRNITFKSNTSIWRAAFWYFVAYLVITLVAAAAQGFYKAPIYTFFIDTLGWGQTGETTADVITMIINSAISFWVFYPIFKVIFKQEPVGTDEAPAEQHTA